MDDIGSESSEPVRRLVGPVVFLLMISMVVPAIGTNVSSATWSAPVVVAPSGSYNSAELAVGGNGLYALYWDYPWGHVKLSKGSLDGSSWASPTDPFGLELYWTAPGICAYAEGSEDVVLVAAAPGYVSKSTDSATTFTRLTDLPIPVGVNYWRYLDICTNASWNVGNPDSTVYLAGSMYVQTDENPLGAQFAISFTKSFDGGNNWLPPIQIGGTDHCTYWPKLVSDEHTLYMFYCGLNADSTANLGMFVRTSSDWGSTWSDEILVETPASLGIFARAVQHLTPEKAMLMCVDYGNTHANSVLRYGYFNYATLTFDEIGSETGSDWNFIYCALGGYLTADKEVLMVWANGVPGEPSTIYFTSSRDTAFANTIFPWTEPVAISESANVYFGLDLELGQNNLYALSYVYNAGPTLLYTSADGGASWSSKSLVGYSPYTGEPGMCVYKDGPDDVVLVASGQAGLLKSSDNGTTFAQVSDFPRGVPSYEWRFMAVGTNASWFGTWPDSDIYVIGSMRYYESGWIGGGYALTFTKSSDGGLTWSTPVRICESNHDTQFPEMISDGSNLYVVYSDSDTEFADLYVRNSSDWGATWSEEKVLLARQPESSWMCAYSFQHLNAEKALLTLGEYGYLSDVDRTPTGRYGYFDYANQTFTEVGFLNGPDWMVGGGFAGKLTTDGVFCLALIKEVAHPLTDIWYTTNAETGLTLPERPPMPAIRIEKGASPEDCTYQFTAAADGLWQAMMENHGLRSVFLYVYDVTSGGYVKLLSKRISFTSNDAYPEGIVYSSQVDVVAGHVYEVVFKKPAGMIGGFAFVYDVFSSPTG